MNQASVRRALSAATARFGFSDTARLDAELLMAHALDVTRQSLLLGRLDDPEPPGFAALVERRAAHEPVAYIIGTRGFWSIELAVGPGALVPRADSETLIEAALDRFGGQAPASVLDLGTGPGTLLLALLDEWQQARGIGVDRSAAALDYARVNAGALGLAARASFVRGDWAAAIDARFDCVVANPPYIARGDQLPEEVVRHEPATALFAGADGLNDYRRILPMLPRLLARGGAAFVEIGARQGDALLALARENGLGATLRRDLAGHNRCVIVTA